jgi:methylated-DNA-[protein]-cysteine S-methyltransferase
MTDDRLAPPTFDPAAAAAAAARFAAEAPADVSYAVVDSPLGRLLTASTPRGLARVSYLDVRGGLGAVLDDLAERVSPRILEAPGRLDDVRRELDEYFAGRRTRFDVPVDWSVVDGFVRRVLRATAGIPFGEVSTYGAIAARAGSPKASRATGNALGANPMPIVVPCHRVLRAGGVLGGYTGGVEKKETLLRIEGVLLG